MERNGLRRLAAVLVALQIVSAMTPALAQGIQKKDAVRPAGVSPKAGPPAGVRQEPVVRDRRLALVVGNATYRQKPLDNSVNDARAVAETLKELGFEVMLRENQGIREFRASVREFANRARDEDGVALFYFAGHAVSMDGRNFLLPVDMPVFEEEAIRDDAVDVDENLMRRLDQTKKQVKIVILDSCRDNPFRGMKTRSMQAGLAEMGQSKGTLIAFSTAPGRVAEDGYGSNSLFTLHLVAEMRKEGIDAEAMFQAVRIAVARATAERQIPWVNTSLLTKFYFRPGDPPRQNVDAGAAALRRQLEEQERISLAVETAERRHEEERRRWGTEREESRRDTEARIKALMENLARERQAREQAEQEARRREVDFAGEFERLQREIAQLQEQSRGGALAASEAERLAARAVEAGQIRRRAEEDRQRVASEEESRRRRTAAQETELDRIVASAAAAEGRPRAERATADASGVLHVRGVRLPADARIVPLAADVPAGCRTLHGAWGQGRWDARRSVEIWVEEVDSRCDVRAIYGRGGNSFDGSPPSFERVRGRVSDGRLQLRLASGDRILLRADDPNAVRAEWTGANGGSFSTLLRRIADDPAIGTQAFAQETEDFGITPTRFIQPTTGTRPVPGRVPGTETITAMELAALRLREPELVLVDAFVGDAHMSVPGAIWLPDVGSDRLGALERDRVETALAAVTRGRFDMPIVVFERSVGYGWHGYNAALRLLGLGYGRVYWFRGGLDAWHDAGLELRRVGSAGAVAR